MSASPAASTSPPASEAEEEPPVLISPPPRPLPKPGAEDNYARYQSEIKAQATELFQRLQRGPVAINADILEPIQWLRGHNVRIKARMHMGEPTTFELEGWIDRKSGQWVPFIPAPPESEGAPEA